MQIESQGQGQGFFIQKLLLANSQTLNASVYDTRSVLTDSLHKIIMFGL